MKLCDRCPQAGSCLLNYLGKACHKLRMQECPEVVPTTLENNFETIGLLWGVYLRAAHPEYARAMPINGITAKDAGTMLALLKVARIATGSSPDSFIDLAGYAACAGEIVTERSRPYEKAETQTQE